MTYLSMLLIFSVLCLLGANLAVAQTNPNCPLKWKYCVKSNKCLQVFGVGTDGVPKSTWSQADEYCRRFSGGHLASFDSEEELTFVVDLTQNSGYDDTSSSLIHNGLSYNSAVGWEHPDGSNVKYLRWWRPDQNPTYLQGQYPAGQLMTRRVWTSYMWVETATIALPFVCQVAPMSPG